MTINETHDAKLRSWVASANQAACEFPIQNLPFAVFRRRASGEAWRGGVAIGDQVLDLAAAQAAGVFSGDAATAASAASGSELNALMALGPRYWSALRLALSRLLREGAAQAGSLQGCLVPQSAVEYTVPARIGDYTDFYTSIHHATNVGRLFRPDNPLMPNFKWIPIGYHGRASSIGISGQQFHRPRGQILPPGAAAPVFGPCKRLDYELEVGIWMGPGNALGQPIPLAEVEQHLFGLCLLNDWSARDIQAWEYQPLGPFLAKNFATTISPWIVTMEALEPYRLAWQRDAADPQPLPYLESEDNRSRGAIDLHLEVQLETASMRGKSAAPSRLSTSNFRHSYWTAAQMITHHAVGGCNLNPGDLFGTGTQSGPDAAEGGALLELSVGGKQPLTLNNGETRTFLEDGDTVILRGWCEKPGFARIGFGECRGTV
ncbi:MAG: fumarylacetoacetase, partial [Burkholderiales bacterium]|nr:fumarylacetoacetase [Burkholderiales bacterium]